MGRTASMLVFGDSSTDESNKCGEFDWMKKHTSAEFYERNIKEMEKEYGRYADRDNMIHAYLIPAIELIKLGIEEGQLELLDISSAKMYLKFYGKFTFSKFMELYGRYGDNILAFCYHSAKDLEGRLGVLGLSGELSVLQRLPDIQRGLVEGMPLREAVCLLGVLKKEKYCCANLSGVSEYIGLVMEKCKDSYGYREEVFQIGGDEKVSLMRYREGNDFLVFALRLKLSKLCGEQAVLLSLAKACKYFNPGSVYWVAIRADDRMAMMPLYQFLAGTQEIEGCLHRDMVCISLTCAPNVIYIVFSSYGMPVKKGVFPMPPELEDNSFFPLEKACNTALDRMGERYGRDLSVFIRLAKRFWEIPFILLGGGGWDRLFLGTPKTLNILSEWKQGRPFNETMMRFLHYRVSASFPIGDFSHALFPDGTEVDLIGVFGQDGQGVINELGRKGFPNCKFVRRVE